jgi:hypothetical protein
VFRSASQLRRISVSMVRLPRGMASGQHQRMEWRGARGRHRHLQTTERGEPKHPPPSPPKRRPAEVTCGATRGRDATCIDSRRGAAHMCDTAMHRGTIRRCRPTHTGCIHTGCIHTGSGRPHAPKVAPVHKVVVHHNVPHQTGSPRRELKVLHLSGGGGGGRGPRRAVAIAASSKALQERSACGATHATCTRSSGRRWPSE